MQQVMCFIRGRIGDVRFPKLICKANINSGGDMSCCNFQLIKATYIKGKMLLYIILKLFE